jgi:N-acetyl-gamma-glutamyl-phosphate reductase
MRFGIATTITVPASGGSTVEMVYASWKKTYGKSAFIQLLPSGETPDTAHVIETNRVDMSAVYDPRTNNFILTSAEDNLYKGTGGQAVQTLNLWEGWSESAGLL